MNKPLWHKWGIPGNLWNLCAGPSNLAIAQTAFEEIADQIVTACNAHSALLAACKSVLEALDVGGEQSRAFAEEIALLTQVLAKAKS